MAPRHLTSPKCRRRATTTTCLLLLVLLSVASANALGARADADADADAFFSSGVPPSPDLVRCLNADEDGTHTGDYKLQRTVYRDFVEGRPARLRYWTGRWSAKKQQASSGDGADGGDDSTQRFQTTLTLASSLTVARLDQLEAQCRLWPRGPVSAVVYHAVRVEDEKGGGANEKDGAGAAGGAERLSDLSPAARQELDQAARAVAAAFQRAEADPQGCLLDVVLLFEAVADGLMPSVPPVNAMRNHALLAARTPLVAVADVDLLPSLSLSRWLALSSSPSACSPSPCSPAPSAAALLQAACDSGDALFVLPAFETPRSPDEAAAHAAAERAARAETKADLERMAAAGKVRQFALPIFHEGHDDTGYARWWRIPFYSGAAQAKGGGADTSAAAAAPGALLSESSAYAVRPSKDYEPWFVIGRARNPWYDARFRGYGWNKVTHVARAKALGFAFRVLPSGYLVHRQHARSAADLLYQSQKGAYEAAAAAEAKKAAAGRGGDGATPPSAVFESVAGVTHRLRDAVVEALARGDYAPALDEGLRRCVATLPWWRDVRGRAVEDALGPGAGAAVGAGGGAAEEDEGAEAGAALLFVGAGRAGERAHLAATLAEYGGALPQRRRRRS
jgi:hypothetical protein